MLNNLIKKIKSRSKKSIAIVKSSLYHSYTFQKILYFKCKILLSKKYRNREKINIIIGSGGFRQKGWISTEEKFLNLLNKNDWNKLFRRNSISAILAEHVWEHLSEKNGKKAVKNCFTFLKNDGYLRIAVPDGYHPNEFYINSVKVNGTGSGAKDHKVLFTYKSLCKMLQSSGFQVRLLEYFDENGKFHYHPWGKKDGFVSRSKKYDERNQNSKLNYTSLIIDAIKF